MTLPLSTDVAGRPGAPLQPLRLALTLPLLVLVTGAALSLSACGPDGSSKPQGAAAAAAEAETSTAADAAADVPADATAPVMVLDADGNEITEAARAEQVVDALGIEVAATASFSEEQVRLAVFSAHSYVDAAFDDPALLNGSWYDSGADPSTVEATFGMFLDDARRSEVMALATTISAAGGADIPEDTLLLDWMLDTGFTGTNSAYAPSPLCTGDQPASCLHGGGFGNPTWEFREDSGRLIVRTTFTAANHILSIADPAAPQEGVQTYEYDLEFVMVENQSAVIPGIRPTYVVGSHRVTWRSTGWTALT